MKVRALNRKLLRELLRLKGQILTIALVIASGITSFIALRGTYASLEASRQAYYDRYRFAHVFARVKRAPESLASRIEALPGVARAQTRVAEEVTLPIEGMARPAYGRLLSLPANAEPATNALCIVQGRAPERGHDDEIVVLKAFADAHRLEPGQRVPAVLGGKLRQLRVVGIALSPEFVYAIRPGAMVDDPTRYAVLWMERTTLAAAFQMEGAFNDVTLRLQPEASETAVRAALDHLLAAYGADGAHGRKEQVSNRILGDELGQLATLSAMIPLVFLGVAAFLVNLVLGRLIRLQRHELATLKAVGYTNREIGWHYLGLVVVVMVPGMVLGLLGGWAFGRVVVAAYGNVFRFPELSFRMSASTVTIALLVSALSAAVGAVFAVRSAVRLPPAEAMRPPAPAHYRRSVVERMGLATLLGPTWMMVVREVLRRPFRTLLSSLGIAGAVALLILGRFGWDSISHYFEAIFLRQQRQDLSVNFARPIDPRAVGELRRWPGVLTAEGLRAVPVRARFEQRVRDSVLIGMPSESTLRRLVTRFGSAQELSKDGVVITATLGQVLGLRLGDRIDLDVLEGDRRRIRPVVDGFLDEANGLQVYAPKELVAELSGDHGTVSSVLLRVDPLALADVERRLSRSPQVIDIADAVNDMQRLRDMNASFIDIWTVVSIVLAASVIFGVNYNNARIALAARSRDLASLRVLGYSRREVAKVLFGGLAIEVALAVPLGLVLGRVWAEQFMRTSLDPETFRWSVTVAPRTYFMAATVAIVSAAASALWVRRSLNDLDLIGVLKTRE
ncbi:MAG TPA: FtsX-like permease family protein [Polyangiaceae bacterium]|nr:FtsX-like permease family protein [Polyangiaceae bacterium]